MRVLIVEDDEILGEAIRDQVAADGHAVDWMKNLDDADAGIRVAGYELILLDLQLPDGDGISFLKRQRDSNNNCPVIILTARDRISDRIAGLDAGADDYLTKPFDLHELSARIKAVARRYAGNPNPKITIGNLSIDQTGRGISVGEENVDLTGREWAIFDVLMRRPGTIVSKSGLEDALYAFGEEIESNTVEVHISRLRKKLGKQAIETVRGVGYRLAK